MRFRIVVNSVQGDRFDSDMSEALYAVLSAFGFRREERWPSGSLSSWRSTHSPQDDQSIAWDVLLETIQKLQAEVEITTERH